MAIKNLLSLFKRIVFKDKDITRCVSLIKSSGKFDKQFYLSQQPGVNFEHLSEKMSSGIISRLVKEMG